MSKLIPTVLLLFFQAVSASSEFNCPNGMDRQVIDFDTDVDENVIAAGGPLTANMPFGMTVRAKSTQGGANVNVPAWLYNSNLSGGADPDLESNVGNVAIIQDQSAIPVPNDFGGGGVLRVDFDVPLYIQSIDLVDTNTVTRVRLFDTDGNKVGMTNVPAQPENAVVTVTLDQDAVQRIRIKLEQSGGITSLAVCLPLCDAGDETLVITEIMINPSAVADSRGEWIEVYNPGATDIDMMGWHLGDNDTDFITVDQSVIVPSGEYVVLARNSDVMLNGGVNNTVFDYPGLIFTNTGDEVFLYNPCDEVVDSVVWGSGFGQAGASYALMAPTMANEDLANGNWCVSVTPYGDGDLGTPGAANDCVY